MGAKPSVKIETPVFVESEWQYEPPQNQQNAQYGVYRTLSNRKTGEMIDEYDMSWINQEEYAYYLKSFNWRYNQPNVVNTRFIVQKSRHQFCSQTFVARVYIEHIIVRLSQINDIPFPQNLYVIMESLQGYAKIYEHSRYFMVDEDQICVDVYGNVKIWINSNLSINYPTAESYEDDENAGEEAMVDRLIRLIASNTDRQSQPEMSFLDYYDEKRGFRGKKFEEARVLVLAYARLSEAQIPDKFESVLNLGKVDQETVQEDQNILNYPKQNGSFTPQWDNRNYQPLQYQENFRPLDQQIALAPPHQFYPYSTQAQQKVVPYQVFSAGQPISVSSHTTPTISFGPKSHIMRNVPLRVDSALLQPSIVQPLQQLPPNYSRGQIVPSQMMPQRLSFQRQQIPPFKQFQPDLRNESNLIQRQNEFNKRVEIKQRTRPKELDITKKQIDNKINELDSPVNIKINSLDTGDIRVTLYNDQDHFEQRIPESEILYNQEQKEEMFIELPSNSIFPGKKNQTKNLQKERDMNVFKVPKNNNFYTQHAQMSQTDDMVAKSLPLKAQYPANNNNQLFNAFGQSDRSINSHIQTKQHVESFGLKESAQDVYKQTNIKNKQKLSTIGSTIQKSKNKPTIKYYYSLSEQLEIDPDIAADMTKYLST